MHGPVDGGERAARPSDDKDPAWLPPPGSHDSPNAVRYRPMARSQVAWLQATGNDRLPGLADR